MSKNFRSPSRNGKLLIIRADASREMGTGHVMRMLALAQAWCRRGGRAQFLCCSCPDGIRDRIEEAGFSVVFISAEPGSKEDLEALLQVVRQYPRCRVVLDNYHYKFEYQSAVREMAGKLMVVDDYGHLNEYDADILLNQNPSAEALHLSNRVHGAVVLAGTEYALLREEFLDKRPKEKIIRDAPLNVLVMMGGGDPYNVTHVVLQALSKLSECIREVRVLVGAVSPHKESIREFAEQVSFSCTVLENETNMPGQLEWGDFAISAAGSTCWELAYMQIPTALVVVADNQCEIADSLTSSGASINLGWHKEFREGDLEWALGEVLSNSEKRQSLVCACRDKVDGRGADRVAGALDDVLRITIATEETGWMRGYVDRLVGKFQAQGHQVTLAFNPDEIPCGDLLFLLSYWRILPAEVLQRNVHNLVVHESALPDGRGWSPVTWQVLEGKNEIPVTLFEAEEEMDAGAIYVEGSMSLTGAELIEEIREEQVRVTFELCEEYVSRYPQLVSKARKQDGQPSFYSRLGPEDSRLDPEKSIAGQFNRLRVVDNEDYPAFFELFGYRYFLTIERELISKG